MTPPAARFTALLVCSLWTSAIVSQSPARSSHQPVPRTEPRLTPAGDTRAVVLYFIASDCPVSNRLLPEMLRIEREFASRHVRFIFVYPNSNETPAAIAAHRIAYGIQPNTLTDPRRQLAKLAGANVTPESAILVPQGKSLKPVYTGRIDDRYLSLGTERPAATHHDLEDAVNAVLANHPVPPPGGPPVGCAFMTLDTK